MVVEVEVRQHTLFSGQHSGLTDEPNKQLGSVMLLQITRCNRKIDLWLIL